MPQFTVDKDVARLVERLAGLEPFEHLTFNNALKRVLEKLVKLLETQHKGAGKPAIAESMTMAALKEKPRKKAVSPSAQKWAQTVPDLAGKEFVDWKAICDQLQVETGTDSARRRLQAWVKENRPMWPAVPDPD
jgi:hypothetical protein